MARGLSPLRPVPDDAHREAMRIIAQRLAGQRQQLAQRVVERSQQEIVDYRAPSDRHLLEEEFDAALAHFDVLVTSLDSGEPVPEEHRERTREIAAHRVHQGVPLESLLHAARIWATVCWDAVLGVARSDVASEREAALEISGRVSGLVDSVSTTLTNAYLDEVVDRGLLRRDLLDELLTAKGAGSDTARLARRLHLRLEDNYIVVVVRGDDVEVEEARQPPPGARSRLDHMVEETRRHVRPVAGSPLTGMRNGDLVVLYPALSPTQREAVRQDCERLARALGSDVSIGMSGWHEGRASVGLAYAEAKNAVAIAWRMGIHGRAIGLDEVLVDHMLESSPTAHRILEETLRPLVDYDSARQASLVPTLRAFIEARFNVTKAASALFVNPNTVVYRLRRIKELSGRDTSDVDDLLVLSLALKMADLRWRS